MSYFGERFRRLASLNYLLGTTDVEDQSNLNAGSVTAALNTLDARSSETLVLTGSPTGNVTNSEYIFRVDSTGVFSLFFKVRTPTAELIGWNIPSSFFSHTYGEKYKYVRFESFDHVIVESVGGNALQIATFEINKVLQTSDSQSIALQGVTVGHRTRKQFITADVDYNSDFLLPVLETVDIDILHNDSVKEVVHHIHLKGVLL